MISMQVQSPKAQVIGLVEEMPDDSSYDEIVQELGGLHDFMRWPYRVMLEAAISTASTKRRVLSHL